MPLPPIEHLLLKPQQKRRDSITSVTSMDLTSLLNTNRATSATGNPQYHHHNPRLHSNMQYEVPMPVSMNHDMSAAPSAHYAQSQNLYVPNGNGRIKSENGSERAPSPHTSEQSSRYSSQTPQNALAFQQMANQLSNGMRYPSPSGLQQQSTMPMMQQAYHSNAGQDQQYQPQASLGAVQHAVQDQSGMDGGRASAGSGGGLPKAFACSTCAKGFARRSDLARHERIHSGVRPHVCDHPGCGKQFIQRSALTVHSRVHTGEKPHMCERCGKPFSDSSSLARHRRIHSGKRPYRCPYADCQKTFTRRTTLTRHQNHHTGTVEESEAATAAALATRVSLPGGRSRGSDEEGGYSQDEKSPMPDGMNRAHTASPAIGMNGVALSRQSSDNYYMQAMNGGMVVPPHMRSEVGNGTPRSGSPAQYALPVNGAQQRPHLTSNPSSGYNPPQILEPPTTNGQQQSTSGNNSPHLGAQMGGWQSPHQNMQAHQQAEYAAYPDPNAGSYANLPAQLYYQQQQQNMQRPHSTGPMDYHQAPMRGQDAWAQHQQ